MRSSFTAIMLGVAALAALAATAASAQGLSFVPAIVFDAGGKFDRSFNQSAYEGAERFKKEFGDTYMEAEITSATQSEQVFRNLIRRGATVVYATGFSQLPVVKKLAPEFFNVKFMITGAKMDPEMPNVQSALFAEEEGSFLAGIVAGDITQSAKVGFVGGMDLPLIRRFGCGFAQGVKYTNSKVEVMANMVGTTPAAFRDPTRGRELAISQFDRGADVVFAAAGNTGTGVLQAAKDKGKFAIGVDSNQNYLHPGSVATSMVKHVDVAVYEGFKAAKNNSWKPGVRTFNLANGGLSLSVDEHNAGIYTTALQAKVAKAKEAIVARKLVVHDYASTGSCPVAVF